MNSYFIPFENKGGTIVDWDFTNPIHCLSWHDDGHGYAKTWLYNGKRIFLHRFLLNFPPEVDHINRIKLDNTYNNLRSVNSRENQSNKSNHGLFPVGVTYQKHRKYFRAAIYINKHNKSILAGLPDPISCEILYNFVLNEVN
jgi:hypothetical protein